MWGRARAGDEAQGGNLLDRLTQTPMPGRDDARAGAHGCWSSVERARRVMRQPPLGVQRLPMDGGQSAVEDVTAWDMTDG
jgi:hypothetical protein